MKKKIVFLTGTRADFGKMKSLIEITSKSSSYEVFIFVTGMHMNSKYGKTVNEILKCKYDNIFMYYNHNDSDSMDTILSKTIDGFSNYIKDINPDLIVIHGDRVEALAGAITGSLNNIFTCHIEGGEVSGTIDEFIRHSVSKMSRIHLVSNEIARKRLIQMGESEDSIFIIGSPDVDVMLSDKLPSIEFVKNYYDISYENYAILLYHPVTTDVENIQKYAETVVNSVIESGKNFVVIYPNNDKGSEFIFKEYEKFKKIERIKMFPSIRFEYFLVLLKHADFIIGNSSAGIREAPYFGTGSINIGNRQHNRSNNVNIINCLHDKTEIIEAIRNVNNRSIVEIQNFGVGNSSRLFLEILESGKIWSINRQKYFLDI